MLYDLLTSFLNGLAFFGAPGAILLGIAGFLGKHFADKSIEQRKAELGKETERLKGELSKETETHKLRLRKQEILFQKLIDAATAFFSLRRSIEPKFRHPDMEWDEALDDVVGDFAKTEARLNAFAADYGPIVSEANRALVEECIVMASNHQYAPHERTVSAMDDAKEAAESLLEKLKVIEANFVEELHE